MSQLSSDLRSDQLVPHALQAEESVIGSILINSEWSLPEARSLLLPEDFYLVSHQWIYEAECIAADLYRAVDFTTVCSVLEQRNQLAEVGGPAFILSVINKTPSALNVSGYIRIVKAMAWRRKLIGYAQGVVRLAHSDETNTLEIFRHVEQSFRQLAPAGTGMGHSSYQLAKDLLDDLTSPDSEIKPFDGPLKMLNKLISRAYGPGQFVVFAGYTNSGKSTLLAQLAAHASRQVTVLFVTFESVPAQVFNQMVSAESGISRTSIEDRTLSEAERVAAIKATSDLSMCPIEIEMYESVHEIRNACAELQVKYDRPVMVFIDDFDSLAGLMSKSGKYESHDKLAIDLLNLSLECGGGVVCSKQLLIPTDAKTVTNNNKLYDKLLPNIMSVEGGRTIAQKASTLIELWSSDWIRQKVRSSFEHPDLPPGKVQFLGVRYRNKKASGVLSGFLNWNDDLPRFEDEPEGRVVNIDLDYLLNNPPAPTHAALSSTNGDNDD